MKILISNDDGYQAPGINALYKALRDIAQVEIIAPEYNNSAKSNALTVQAPIYINQVEQNIRYSTGTPADCVHIALSGLLDYQPDLIVSGINNGANMGDDTLYSGTVGAAMEGYLFGIPSIAFSQTCYGWQELDSAATQAKFLVQALINDGLPKNNPWLLNVNIPNLPVAQLKGFRITRLGRRHSAKSVIKQQDPRHRTMYWIGSAGDAKDGGEGTDFHCVSQGYISVTPLQIDLTNHEVLPYWSQTINNLTASNTKHDE